MFRHHFLASPSRICGSSSASASTVANCERKSPYVCPVVFFPRAPRNPTSHSRTPALSTTRISIFVLRGLMVWGVTPPTTDHSREWSLGGAPTIAGKSRWWGVGSWVGKGNWWLLDGTWGAIQKSRLLEGVSCSLQQPRFLVGRGRGGGVSVLPF